MRDFKAFATENRVAMVLLAQLSRPENRTKPPRPSMYMLKEAGGIEQIADYVVMIHQERELVQGYEQSRRIMWVEKQRQGVAAREFEVDFRRYRIR
jgi:replicative DNA helicase